MTRLIAALVAAVALHGATVLAAPAPSPALSGILAPPPQTDYAEAASTDPTLLEGEFDARTFVTKTSAPNPDAVQQTLSHDGFVDGYGRTWTQAGTKHVLVEVAIAFSGAEGAKAWLRAAELSVKASSDYQKSLSISGLDTYFGAHYVYAANHSFGDEFAFVKGNDYFDIVFVSPTDDLGTSAATQATAQYSAAPDVTIPKSQWPETTRHTATSSSSDLASVAELGLLGAVLGGLIGLFIWLAIRSRRQRGAAHASPYTGASARLRNTGLILSGIGVLVFFGLVFEFGISGLAAQQSQDALLPAFKAAAQTTELDAPTVNPAQGSPVALLSIPRLGLTRLVVEGSSPDDLKAGPGHLSVSPMPGEFGNAVLLGRRTTYGGPFYDLNRIRPGDHIWVTTGQGTFTYRVSQVGRVSAGDADPLRGTLDSRLTLVTSDPTYVFTGRLVVVAMLQEQPVAVAKRNPQRITPVDLGLAPDPIWFAPAALSAQLLVAAIWLTVRLRRRWPDSVTYMFAGPVIVALTLITVTTLDRGLPGTL